MGSTLPVGLRAQAVLPQHDHSSGWDHLILPPHTKDRLLSHATFSLLHRKTLASQRVAVQGLLLFSGPSGTGKSTAARGLAATVARTLSAEGSTTFLEVDPHALPTDLLGGSQQNTEKLFNEVIPEYAARHRFTYVLVDEVEAFAVSRSSASFDTNPADLHRATDAVLTGLDYLLSTSLDVFFVATTNFPAAVDEALISRTDLTVQFPLPDQRARYLILRDALDELGGRWNAIRNVRDAGKLEEVAEIASGMDGRQVRKLVLRAVCRRPEVASDPNELKIDDLFAVVEESKRNDEFSAPDLQSH